MERGGLKAARGETRIGLRAALLLVILAVPLFVTSDRKTSQGQPSGEHGNKDYMHCEALKKGGGLDTSAPAEVRTALLAHSSALPENIMFSERVGRPQKSRRTPRLSVSTHGGDEATTWSLRCSGTIFCRGVRLPHHYRSPLLSLRAALPSLEVSSGKLS